MAITVSMVTDPNRQVAIGTADPVAQASTNALAAVVGSDVDAQLWRSVCFTIVVATQSIDWSVFGANAAAFTDEVVVQSAATVAAGAASSYAVAQAPFRYYRVKIVSTAPDTHGTATIRATVK